MFRIVARAWAPRDTSEMFQESRIVREEREVLLHARVLRHFAETDQLPFEIVELLRNFNAALNDESSADFLETLDLVVNGSQTAQGFVEFVDGMYGNIAQAPEAVGSEWTALREALVVGMEHE